MRAENDNSKGPVTATDSREQLWLTDVIDQLDREGFARALDRRHAASANRVVVESAALVPTRSP